MWQFLDIPNRTITPPPIITSFSDKAASQRIPTRFWHPRYLAILLACRLCLKVLHVDK